MVLSYILSYTEDAFCIVCLHVMQQCACTTTPSKSLALAVQAALCTLAKYIQYVTQYQGRDTRLMDRIMTYCWLVVHQKGRMEKRTLAFRLSNAFILLLVVPQCLRACPKVKKIYILKTIEFFQKSLFSKPLGGGVGSYWRCGLELVTSWAKIQLKLVRVGQLSGY